MAELKCELLDRRQARPAHRKAPNGRRQGVVLATASEVLGGGERMTVREIHAAVEEALGGSVSVSTVKDALAAHAGGEMARFRRVRRGVYALRAPRLGGR